MKRCNCRAPNTQTAYRMKEELTKRVVASSISTIDEVLYLKPIYHIIYNSNDENISLERIRAQHKVINQDFSMNNSDKVKVPSVDPYNFNDVRGNPNVKFIPLNESELVEGDQIRRVSTSRTSFSGIADVVSSGGSPSVTGCINIYICNLNGVLGEAFIQGNKCTVWYPAIGGPDNLGTISSYNLGRTLTHELGHNFGLFHIFMDIYSGDICSNSQIHPDIPKQSRYNGPNAYLYQSSDGTWTGTGAYNTCSQNDQFMNYMDYVTDNNMVMFSKDQSSDMRSVIKTSGLFELQTIELDGIPDKPVNLHWNTVTFNSVILEWDARMPDTNSVNQYKIEYKTGSELFKIYANLIIVDNMVYPEKISQTVEDLNSGVEYSFRVQAINEIGISEYSDILTVTTLSYIPDMINTLNYLQLYDNKICLHWQHPRDNGSEIDYYYIQEKNRNTDGENYITHIINSENNYSILDLQTNYYNQYRILSENDNGKTDYSNWTNEIFYPSLDYRIYSRIPNSNSIILDSNNNIISDTIVIDNIFKIKKVELIINDLRHTWVGDIKIRLTHNNKTVVIMESPGSGYWGSEVDNFINLVISDEGTQSIEEISNTENIDNSKKYTPNEALSIFNNDYSNGDWILEVEDLYPVEDDGQLNLWGLKLYFDTDIPKWDGDTPLKTDITKNTSNSIYLYWDIPNSTTPLNSYRILQNDSVYYTINSSLDSIYIDGLDYNTEYNFKIQAYNSNGSSDWSNSVYSRTLAIKPYWDIFDINFDTNSFSIDYLISLRLIWSDANNGGATILYRVKINNNLDENFSGNFLTINQLNPNTQYLVEVQAYNSIGNSEWVSGYITTPKVVPYWLNFDMTIETRINSLLCSWITPFLSGQDLLNYQIKLEKDGSLIQTHDVMGNQIELNNLDSGSNYLVSIRCQNTIGYSDWYMKLIETLNTAPIWNNQNVNYLTISSTSVSISWDEPYLGTSNLLQYIVSNNNNNHQTNNNYITIDNLNFNTNYTLKITAFNNFGYSSITSNYKTIGVVPFWEQEPISIEQINNTSIKINWLDANNGGSDIENYNIKVENLNNEIVIDEIQLETEKTITELDIRGTYIINLRATNIYGWSNYISQNIILEGIMPTWNIGSVELIENSHNSLKFSFPSANGNGLRVTYKIYNEENIFIKSVTSNIALIENLESNTSYKFNIKGETQLGSTNFLETRNFLTDNTIPIWPDNFGITIMELESNSIDFSWTKPINTINLKYFIQLKKGIELIYSIENIENNSYLLNNLEYNTEYLVEIQAKNNIGYSDIRSANINTRVVAPYWNTDDIINIIFVDEDIRLEWLIPVNYESFPIQNSYISIEELGGAYSNTFKISGDINYFMFYNQMLKPYVDYTITLRLENEFGFSEYKNKTFRTLAKTPSINSYQIIDIGSDYIEFEIEIKDNGGVDIIDYLVTGIDKNNITLLEYNGNKLKYKATNLVFNTTYNLEYQCQNLMHLNSESIMINFTTLSVRPFWDDVNLLVRNITFNNCEIYWTSLNDGSEVITEYQIMKNEEVSNIEINQQDSYLVTNLIVGSEYIFGIRCKNINGYSDWLYSNKIKMETDIPIIKNLEIDNKGLDNLRLNWEIEYDGGASINQILIRYKKVSNLEYKNIILTNEFNYYNIINLERDTEYEFGLLINNGSFNSEWFTIFEKTLRGLPPTWDIDKIIVENIQLDNVIIDLGECSNYDEINYYYKLDNSEYTKLINYKLLDTTKIIVNSLAPDTNYKFKSEAKNDSGISYLESDEIHTNKSVPLLNELLINVGYNYVNLSWNLPKNGGYPITNYKIYYQKNGDIDFSLFSNLTRDINQVRVIDLVKYSFYRFKLEAYNYLGRSETISKWVKVGNKSNIEISGNLSINGNILLE